MCQLTVGALPCRDTRRRASAAGVLYDCRPRLSAQDVPLQLAHSMAATAALEAHRLEPGRAGSLALAASALQGAHRAQAALASRPGSVLDAKLATYLHLKACPFRSAERLSCILLSLFNTYRCTDRLLCSGWLSMGACQ